MSGAFNGCHALDANSKRVVIIGGGFAGLTLAQKAEKSLSPSVNITVISRDNHLVFTPMLPEVVSRSVSVAHIAVPGRSATKRTTWIEGNVVLIDEKTQTIQYETAQGGPGNLSYSHLVIACGSEAAWDSIPGLKAYGLTVKTAGDAILLGNELIGRFESAAAERDKAARSALLHAVVIGGGFSGVEVAGQINDLMEKLVRSFPEIGETKPHVTVLQRGSRVLPELSHESLSEFTVKKLRASGIDVRLETSAKELTESGVLLESGERIATRLVICTIGTQTAPLITELGLDLEKGRIKTETDMRVTGHRNIWAIGDCAVTTNSFDGKPTSATAQFALREAAQLAKNIARVIKGEPTKPFRFRPQGLLASIGRQNGVAEIFGLQFSGIFAWFLWRSIYLFKIPGLSSKIGVALDWLTSAVFPPPLAKLRLPGYPQPRRAHYAEGDLVFESSHAERKAQFIEKGSASISFDSSSASSAEFQKGDYVGYPMFGDGVKGGLQVRLTAATPLDVIEVDGRAFGEFAESFSPLKAHIYAALKGRTILGKLLVEQSNNKTFACLRVGDAMRPAENLIDSQSTLEQALQHFDPTQSGYWVVDGEKNLLGYFGRLELYDGLASQCLSTNICEMLREAPRPLKAGQDLISSTVSLLRCGLDSIPVTDSNGKVIGVYDLLELIRKMGPNTTTSEIAKEASI